MLAGYLFCPSATELVEQFLEELIDDSPESSFERVTLPQGTLEYLDSINFEDRDVLVGSLRNKEQLQIVLEHKFYHIPYKKVESNRINFKYIAMYQSKESFKDEAGIRYYGKISSWKVVKRKDIKEIPKESDELYVRFEIEEWKQVENRIKPKEYGVRSHVYTNYQLLMNAEFLPELCIRSKEEYRLFMELKRITQDVNVVSKNRKIDDSRIDRFEFEGAVITIEGDMFRIINDDKLKEFRIKEFINKPKTVLGLIRKHV